MIRFKIEQVGRGTLCLLGGVALWVGFSGSSLLAQPLEPVRWVPANGGQIPAGSLPAGTDQNGVSTLYACRVTPPGANNFEIGKIGTGYSGCYIGLNGQGFFVANYQVLAQMSVRWVSTSGTTLPPQAVPGGMRPDGVPEYVCRGAVPGAGGIPVGKRSDRTCDIEMNGREFSVTNFEVLTYPWTLASNGTIPDNSFQGGTDVGGEPLYVCRVSHQGGVHTGKVSAALRNCYIEFFAQSIKLPNYEVLTNFSGTWSQVNNGAFPANRFDGGYDGSFGAPSRLFVCRATPTDPRAGNTKHPGKLVPMAANTGPCQGEFGDATYSVNNYEVLVANNTLINAPPPPIPTGAPFNPNVNTYVYLSNQFQGDNKVMTVKVNGENNFAIVLEDKRLNDPAQLWVVTPNESSQGTLRLYNDLLGRGWSLDSSATEPVIGPSATFTGQFWTITEIPQAPGFYRLTNQFQGVNNSLDSSPTAPIIAATGLFTGQAWKFTPAIPIQRPNLTGDFFRLRSTSSGQYMNMENRQVSQNPVVGALDASVQSSHWAITQVAGTPEPFFRISNRANGGFLAIANNQLTTVTGAAAQTLAAMWYFEPMLGAFRISNRGTGITIGVALPAVGASRVQPNSQFTQWSIEPVVSVAPTPSLVANPTSLSFNHQLGAAAPSSQSVTITASSGAANFTVGAPSANFFSVTPSTGSAGSAVTVSINTVNLTAAGTINGNFIVSAQGFTSVTVPVSITVTAAAPVGGLTASPTAINASFTIGGATPTAQSIAIAVSAGAPAAGFTIETPSVSWITVSPMSGVTPATLNITFNPVGLPAGIQTTNVTIRPLGAGSALTVPVALSVLAAGNTGGGGGAVTPPQQGGMIAQIADGDTWQTQIILVNRDAESAPFTLRFWNSSGTPMPLGMQGNVGPPSAVFEGTIPVGGSRILTTLGIGGVLSQGWAELITTKSIGAITVFRWGQTNQEAAVTLSPPVARFYLPFDNTLGYLTSMAMMNSNPAVPAAIQVTLRDEFGTTIGTDVVALAARGHIAFTIPQRFPQLAGRRGVLEFVAATPDISGLGLRFTPSGAFTSFPVQIR